MTNTEAAAVLRRILDQQGTLYPDEDLCVLLDDEKNAISRAIESLERADRP